MKTIKLQKFLAALTGITISFAISACCNESSTNEPENPVQKEYVRAQYRLDLAQSWYDLFDIEVTYTDVTGATTTIKAKQNAIYEATIALSNATQDYSFTVKAKPKNQMPEIEDNATYSLNQSCAMYIYRYSDNDDDAHPVYNAGKSTNARALGSNMREYVSHEYSLINGNYSLSK